MKEMYFVISMFSISENNRARQAASAAADAAEESEGPDPIGTVAALPDMIFFNRFG